MEILPIIISIASAAGLGGIVGAYFQARFQERTKVNQQQQGIKQKRYMCILILMLTKLDPDAGMPKVRVIRPDLQSTTDVDFELQTEPLNAFIFANNKVLKSLSDFIQAPSQTSFSTVALTMRQDLWGKRAKLPKEFVQLIGSNDLLSFPLEDSINNEVQKAAQNEPLDKL